LFITRIVIIIIRAENESYDTCRNEYRIETMTDEIIVVSTPYLSGYRVTKTIGFTWGLIVRSRGLGGNIFAGLRTIFGGEIHEYTELLNQSREMARDRLKEHAQALGANAVFSVEFDSTLNREHYDRSACLWHRCSCRKRSRHGKSGETWVNCVDIIFSFIKNTP
jgi:uncharacterized protein YbjQ (UPF0145 family)